MFALLAVCSQTVNAHPVHVQRGTVTLDDRQMMVQFPVSDHDAEHVNATVDALARDLIFCLRVFDEHGEALAPQSTVINDQGCVIEIKLRENQQFVTFQQRIGPESIVRNRMIELAMKRSESSDSNLIRLSAGGNAETIDLRSVEPTEESKHIDRFHELLLYVEPGENQTTIELHVPAPLLEMWIALNRQAENSIRATEVERNADAITKWFLARLTPGESAGNVSLRVEQVAVLGPGEDRSADEKEVAVDTIAVESRDTIVGYWCARIVVRAIIEHPAEAPLDLECKLFNSKVLTVKTAIIDGDKVTWTTLSTYAPHLHGTDAM